MSIKIAGVQMDVQLKDKQRNLETMLSHLKTTSSNGAQITIFPECALTGYCYSSMEEAMLQAEDVSGPSIEKAAEACQALNTHMVFGMIEKEGDRIFNAAALVGPNGLIDTYRKVHTLCLGVDRFTTPGDRHFKVYDVAGLKLGMLICYDASIPEASRVLALKGADLISVSTAWPEGSFRVPKYVINSRALENRVYVAAVNRVGDEGGFRFIGQSKFCNPLGDLLAEGDGKESILYTEIDVELARTKKVVRTPNEFELDFFGDRRPDTYDEIIRPL